MENKCCFFAKPNELPVLPFACTSCTVHFSHLLQGVGDGVSHFLHVKELSPEPSRTHLWPPGAGLRQTSSLQPARAGPGFLGQTEAAPVHSPTWLRSLLLALPSHFLILRWFELRKAGCRALLACAAALPGSAALPAPSRARKEQLHRSSHQGCRAGPATPGNSPLCSVSPFESITCQSIAHSCQPAPDYLLHPSPVPSNGSQ